MRAKSLTLILLLALSACTDTARVAADFAPVLSDSAHQLMDGRPSGAVPESEWPYAIRDVLDPVDVRVHADGLYIATSRFFVEEEGVFVPRRGRAFTPIADADPAYTLVALDVYSYRISG